MTEFKRGVLTGLKRACNVVDRRLSKACKKEMSVAQRAERDLLYELGDVLRDEALRVMKS